MYQTYDLIFSFPSPLPPLIDFLSIRHLKLLPRPPPPPSPFKFALQFSTSYIRTLTLRRPSSPPSLFFLSLVPLFRKITLYFYFFFSRLFRLTNNVHDILFFFFFTYVLTVLSSSLKSYYPFFLLLFFFSPLPFFLSLNLTHSAFILASRRISK